MYIKQTPERRLLYLRILSDNIAGVTYATLGEKYRRSPSKTALAISTARYWLGLNREITPVKRGQVFLELASLDIDVETPEGMYYVIESERR